jgi:hypothetical protein
VLSPANAIVAAAERLVVFLGSGDARSGKAAIMNTQQATLLIISDTSDGPAFILPQTHKRYSHLIAPALRRRLKTKQDWEILGRVLITICEYAHDARHIQVLREVSEFLISLPIRKELRAIGSYYRAVVLHRIGQFNSAQGIYEQLATDPRFPWKTKTIAAVAGCHLNRGDLDEATALYLEALRSTGDGRRDLRTCFMSQCMIAVIRSVQGDHQNAIGLLETIYPVAHYIAKVHPATYYDYLNSLAVRHTALGHFNEAERLCEITLSSPFCPNFPNWAETRDELFAAKDAAAATVYVNVEPTPKPKRTLRREIINRSDLTIDPNSKNSIEKLAEAVRTWDSKLFVDSALSNIAFESVPAKTDVESSKQPENKQAPDSKLESLVALAEEFCTLIIAAAHLYAVIKRHQRRISAELMLLYVGLCPIPAKEIAVRSSGVRPQPIHSRRTDKTNSIHGPPVFSHLSASFSRPQKTA